MDLKEIKWLIICYGIEIDIANRSKVCQDMIRLSIQMIMRGEY